MKISEILEKQVEQVSEALSAFNSELKDIQKDSVPSANEARSHSLAGACAN